MTDTVRTERDGEVLIVTIDRPEVRNAVDGPTSLALADTFRAFDADDELAVAVFTGANGTFCAGADLKTVADGPVTRVRRWMTCFRRSRPQPSPGDCDRRPARR